MASPDHNDPPTSRRSGSGRDRSRRGSSFVIWRRLCYGCQSERGLRFVERVMTVAMTLRKRDRDVLDYITRCVRSNLAGASTPALSAA